MLADVEFKGFFVFHSCRNLINADIITKSDPYCVVWMQEPRWQDQYYEIGRTETIDDNLNPQWVKKFVFAYSCEF